MPKCLPTTAHPALGPLQGCPKHLHESSASKIIQVQQGSPQDPAAACIHSAWWAPMPWLKSTKSDQNAKSALPLFKQALNPHFSGRLPVLFRNSRSLFFLKKGKASDTQCDNQHLSEHSLLTQRTSCQDRTKLPPLPHHPQQHLPAGTFRTEASGSWTQMAQQPR